MNERRRELTSTDDDEINTSTCPQCEAEQEDQDGFGVLFCEACGYCTHASVDGNTCGFCGQAVPT